MMRLYAPGILLLICAAWLAWLGDGVVFGVVVLALLGVAVLIQVREQHRLFTERREREHRER